MGNINKWAEWLKTDPDTTSIFFNIAMQESETNTIYNMFAEYLEQKGEPQTAEIIKKEIMPEENKHALIALEYANKQGGIKIEDYEIEKR